MADKGEIISWLQLANTDKIGAITLSKLINRHQSPQKALATLSNAYPHDKAEAEYEKACELGVAIIVKNDPRYPQKLLNLEDAPPVLYAKGNISLLNHPTAVAIVGARNATINGRKLTAKIAFDLTNNDILVVSGMARGIDTSAHKGAMYAKAQTGPTIAVLGTGVDVVYPLENKELYEQIANQGLIISEFALGTTALTGNFPRRNRIVSGLSQGVLVVEATEKSGSLITAKQAATHGKMLFAVPGSPNEARSMGPNLLLKNGANLVENANDIINFLGHKKHTLLPLSILDKPNLFTKPLDICPKDADISTIESILSIEPTSIDEVIRASGLNVAEVSSELVMLELEDKIVRLPGNRVALKKKVKK